MKPCRRRNGPLFVETLESRIALHGGGLGPPAFIPPDGPIFEQPPEGHPDFDTPPIVGFVPGEPPVDAPPSHGDGTLQQVAGANWIEFDSRGHRNHGDHVTWNTDPTTDTLITVTVLIHDHGNLSADKLARFNDAVAEVNTAASNSFGVLLDLQTTTNPSATHQIHLHEDTSSGCGGSALGCAEYSLFAAHTGQFDDGHRNHLYAGEDSSGGRAEATLLSGFNWYAGADASSIGANQYDYQTVAAQELLHLVGLGHDSTVYNSDPEVAENSDLRSVMHGSLGQGITRRRMSTHDQDTLAHQNGVSQTPEAATVVGRHIFYNDSFYDDGSAAIHSSDDLAIDTSKSAYLPGVGTGSFANATPYTNGINGIMIDLAGGGSHASISASDFIFKVGNDNTPSSWTAAPAALAVSARLGAGVSGSDRVEITWANGTVTNTWLEVQVKANGNTGLADTFGGGIGDVFFFGNKVADSDNLVTDSFDAFPIFGTVPSTPLVTNTLDYNKSGAIDLFDAFPVFAPANGGAIVALTIPSGGPFAPGGGEVSPATAGGVGAGITSGLASSSSSDQSETLPGGVTARLETASSSSAVVAKYAALLAAAGNDNDGNHDDGGDDVDLDDELLEVLAAALE